MTKDPRVAAFVFAVLVTLTGLGALCYGLFRGVLWFLNRYGVDGFSCILSGLTLVLATEAGLFYLAFRITDQEAKEFGPRRAAARKLLYFWTLYLAPMIAVGVVFAPILAVAFPGPFITAVIVIPGLVIYLIYFLSTVPSNLVWKHAAFAPKVFCPECSKHVGTDKAWICGDCHCVNDDVFGHSFFQRCARCGSFASEYRCPHTECQKPIYLGPLPNKNRGRLATNPATLSPEVLPTPLVSDEEKQRAKETEAAEIQHQIRIAKMHAELSVAEQEREKHKPISSRVRLEQRFREYKRHHLDIHEIAAAERTWAKEEFKHDPQARRQHKALVKMFVEEQLAMGVEE